MNVCTFTFLIALDISVHFPNLNKRKLFITPLLECYVTIDWNDTINMFKKEAGNPIQEKTLVVFEQFLSDSVFVVTGVHYIA